MVNKSKAIEVAGMPSGPSMQEAVVHDLVLSRFVQSVTLYKKPELTSLSTHLHPRHLLHHRRTLHQPPKTAIIVVPGKPNYQEIHED